MTRTGESQQQETENRTTSHVHNVKKCKTQASEASTIQRVPPKNQQQKTGGKKKADCKNPKSAG
jgi:hypothetical protein